MLSEMALAGMAGRAMAGTVGTGVSRVPARRPKAQRGGAPRSSRRPTSDSEALAIRRGVARQPRAVVTGVAVELREFAKLRDEGILTDEEYTEQKNRLLGR